MAITGAIFNSLTFGGVNSADYGIYISGEGVFDAPTRDVELISVPGRNGDIEIDKGRFNNITVTYPAGVFGDDTVDFRERLSDFRNAILSQRGYQRLSDTYHPDEFRLGLYVDGLEVNPVHYNEAGEFNLSFNCKPQRFLVSGEEAVTVASGDTLENPTLFESSPLVEVVGQGGFSINNSNIELYAAQFGWVTVSNGVNANKENNVFVLDMSLANNDDRISTAYGSTRQLKYNNGTILDLSGSVVGGTGDLDLVKLSSNEFAIRLTVPEVLFRLGTELHVDLSGNYTVTTSNDGNVSGRLRIGLTYRGDNRFSVTSEFYQSPSILTVMTNRTVISLGPTKINSTKNILGNPTYIDFENGEAYKIENDAVIDLNSYISLPPDLPKLVPGDNSITCDNTITSLKIAPRWWKL